MIINPLEGFFSGVACRFLYKFHRIVSSARTKMQPRRFQQHVEVKCFVGHLKTFVNVR